MNRYVYILFMWLCSLSVIAQTDGYNPNNPPLPNYPKDEPKDTTYTLVVNSSPYGSGSLNTSGGTYKQGASVYLRANNNGNNLYFMYWIDDEGNTLSTSTSFNYVMPKRDAVVTAVYRYSPSNPALPNFPENTTIPTYNLYLNTKPAGAGTFNASNSTLKEGESIHLYAYSNSNFYFKQWEDAKGNIISTAQNFYYTMPAVDTQLYAIYTYNPANPANPRKNHYDSFTGEVIVDDFTKGNLSSAVNDVTKGNTSNITSIIVAGVINNNDFSIANNYSSCSIVDLSRTNGVNTVPSYCYDGNTHLNRLSLPACITNIEYRAFRNATALTELTCHATVPPTLGSNVFSGVNKGLVVYVPASSIQLYEQAAGWKEYEADGTIVIMPIQSQVSALEVNLPAECADGRYKNMPLELLNVKSGQKFKYVVTDRINYTFNNLVNGTRYVATLKNLSGQVLAKTDTISITDENVSVTFDLASMKQLRSVKASVLTKEGTDVTSNCVIIWYDANGTFLSQSKSLEGQVSETKVRCAVSLSQALAMEYVLPADSLYEVVEGENNVIFTLAPLPKMQLSGRILDVTTQQAVSNANITVSQTLNGKYSKSFTAKTDNKGAYTITVFAAPTTVTYASNDYVSQTFELADSVINKEASTLADVRLKPITGATITTNFTYASSVAAGIDPEIQNYYSDYNNVAYSIYNVTAQKEIRQFNVQYPNIVLLEEVSEGDSLTIVAKSKNGSFKDITTGGRIDAALRMNVTVPVIQWGGVDATFTTTENSKVLGILYDSKGTYVNKYNYGTATLSIRELKDGEYTLVTMGASDFFGSIYNLEKFSEAGLQQNIDYLVNKVTVKSGIISPLKNVLVPFFDESKFYYTGDNTSFTVNKTSIVAGNYLTLTAKVDFKEVYKSSISDVKISVELPEGTTMVDNSVMVGSSVAYYELNGNTLTIPLDNNVSSDRVRFCVIPTQSGSFAPNASVAFKLGDKSVSQPMGSTSYTVKDIAISVPSEINTPEITITGVASGKADVTVYANGDVLGTTTALANGWWSLTTELDEPYNLQELDIYADVTSSTGLSVKTETQKCLYNKDVIVAKTVDMSFYNGWMKKNITVTFDLEHQTSDATSYSFYHETDFTFAANLSNNDTTIVKSVTISVYTNHEGWIDLEATYNEKMDRWVAVHKFGSSNLPTGVKVDFDADFNIYGDRNFLDNVISSVENNFETDKTEIANLVHEINTLDEDEDTNPQIAAITSLLSQEDCDYNLLNSLIMNIVGTDTLSNYVGDIDSMFEEMKTDYNEWLYDFINGEADSLLLDLNIPSFAISIPELTGNYECTKYGEFGSYTVKSSVINVVDEDDLLRKGYESLEMTDGSRIFFILRNDCTIFIDANRNIQYELYNDSIDTSNARKARSWNNVSGDFVESANSYTACLNALMYSIKRLSSGNNKDNRAWKTMTEDLNAVKDAAECFYEHALSFVLSKLRSAYNTKLNVLNTKIDGSNQKLSEYKSGLYQANKDYQSLETRQILISNELATTSDAEKIARLKTEYQMNSVLIESGKKKAAKFAGYINETEKEIKNLNKTRNILGKAYDFAVGPFEKLPRFLTKHPKLGKTTKVAGKLVGGFGVLMEVVSLYDDVVNAIDDMASWRSLSNAIDSKIPCKNNESAALNLQDRIENDASSLFWNYVRILYSEWTAIKIDAASLAAIECPPAELGMWLVSGALNGYAECSKFFSIENKFLTKQTKYWVEVGKLKCGDDKCPKCHKKPCECEKPCSTCGQKPCACCEYCHLYPCKCERCSKCGQRTQDCICKKCKKCGRKDCVCKPIPEIPPIMDPSGFVYEGVSTNRLPGVTATCYYKELVEDMYGDLHENIVLWDAEEYAQRNPLFTDENGMYQWDVPQGLWQVRFEKEGYVPTQSDWLPVPPPQMDVNIGMVQNAQPEVVNARAYEDGVEIEFSKYMDIESLNSENVYLKVVNGEEESLITDAEIQMMNKEVAIEGSAIEYASKMKLATDTLGYFDEAYLIVSTGVNSYAGIPMAHTFEQKLDVEKKVRELLVDAELNVEYDGQKQIIIAALPADAAAGKKLSVVSASDMIATTDVQEVTFDADGQATFIVNGELYGATALNYSLMDADLKATTLINVVDPKKLEAVKAPVASRISGTSVYRSQTVSLSCESEGATIYYTLDGSCPCDENARMKYERPIAINDAMTIKFMSVGTNFDESDVVECTYSIRQSDVKLNLAKGWNWNSHDVASPLDVNELSGVASRILTQTDEVIDDPVLGFVGTLTTIDGSETMKIEAKESATKSFTGEQYNPALSPIILHEGWNWLGYPISQTMTVADALSYMDADEGDCISNLEGGFATYTDGVWVGSLETMNPGAGYLYKSAMSKSFIYNNVPMVQNAKALYGHRLAPKSIPWSVDKHRYPNLMPMIAQVCYSDGNATDSTYYVGAFVGEECRGVGKYSDGIMYLSVYGDKSADMVFKAWNVDTESVHDFAGTLKFTPDVVGTYSSPYKLKLGFESTGINLINANNGGDGIYNIQGIKLNSIPNRGMYIIKSVDENGNSVMKKTYVK